MTPRGGLASTFFTAKEISSFHQGRRRNVQKNLLKPALKKKVDEARFGSLINLSFRKCFVFGISYFG